MAATTSSCSASGLDALGWAIATDGVAAHRAAVEVVAAAARRAGLSPVAVDVLVDESAPAVARQRAFGAVAAALAAGAATGQLPTFAVAA